MVDVSLYFLALGGGLISFVSPCNAALIPTFASYVSNQSASPKKNVIMSAFFALGYAFTFALVGLLLGALDNLIQGIRYLNLISGTIVIALALYLLREQWMGKNKGNYGQKKQRGVDQSSTEQPTLEKPSDQSLNGELAKKQIQKGNWGAFVLGLSLGSAFIPCVTPMYASILTISIQYGNSVQLALLFLYALGLTGPFVLIGGLLGRIYSSNRLVVSMVKYGKYLQTIFATFMVWVGIEIIFTGYGLSGAIPVI